MKTKNPSGVSAESPRPAQETGLLPCPFCGQLPWSGSVPADDGLGPQWWSVSCGDCEIKIERPTQAMALKDWGSRPTNWRPIETAPKDGTEILGVIKDDLVRVVRFGDRNWLSLPGAWGCTPTLWMPLPKLNEPERDAEITTER